MNRISVFIKEAPRNSLAPLSEVTARKEPSMKQEEGPHQIKNVLVL